MRNKDELRHYQDRVIEFLYARDEAICVARPGAGKTASALTAFTELRRDLHLRHGIVIAPKRVAHVVWPNEISEWAHLEKINYAVLKGTPKQRSEMLARYGERQLTIVGIDLIGWLIEELAHYPDDCALFDLVCIDELSKLRDPSGVRSKMMAKHAHRWRMRWGLSGTLRPSGIENLFMPAKIIVGDSVFGRSFYKFQHEHMYPEDYQGYNWVAKPGHEEIINAAIAPYIVTVHEDELPKHEPIIMLDRIELPPDARKQYDTMEKKLIAAVEEDVVVAGSAAVATGKLAQIANGFLYDEGEIHQIHGEKRAWLFDLVEDNVENTVVVFQYKEDFELIRQVLGDFPYLGAGVTDKQSDDNIARWNAGEIPYLGIQIQSAAHGLNLQAGGAQMWWLAPNWSPELHEQCIARLARSGQTRTVMVRICVATDTVDELKLSRVYSKMSAQAAFEAYLRRHQLAA